MRYVSRLIFFFLHMNIQLFQCHLLKSQSSLHWIALATLSKMHWLWVYFWTPLCCIDLCSIFSPIPPCLDYCSFIANGKIRYYEFSTSVLIYRIVLSILAPLFFHINFRISLLRSAKKHTVGSCFLYNLIISIF